MSVSPKPVPVKHCETCGLLLERKRFGGRLEDRGVFLRRRFCSRVCGYAYVKPDAVKDTHHWRARKHRKDACETCGATDRLHVHHKDRDPFNDDRANLQTLCDSCHLRLHWREDRAERIAAMPRKPPKSCVICGGEFRPRHRRIQTCSPECKSALLSIRTTEHYANRGAA